MTRWPVIPTIVVGLAIAAMIALGVWQLDRKDQKEAAIARYAANVNLPPIAFPNPPVGDEALFRKSSAYCTRVMGWQRMSGRSASGRQGWRVIAECASGAEGPSLFVQLGIGKEPTTTPVFAAGEVAGFISHAPDTRSLIGQTIDRRPKQLMLVAATPPAGLDANPGPDISAVPNNHLAYAGQWFFFALIAGVIYVLALRRRGAKPGPGPS